MTALAFIENYQRIRKQYFDTSRSYVPRLKQKKRIVARFVYVAPIGPILPVRYDPKSITQGMAFAHEIIESGKILQVPRNRGTVILREVAEKHKVSVEDLISERRHQYLVRPRQEVMYRLCTETDWSLPRIGRLLGGRDHTTVLHGRRKFEALLNAGEVTL